MVEPGEKSALHHPPRLAESGTVRGAAAGDLQAPGLANAWSIARANEAAYYSAWLVRV